jgi:cytidylate kinase
MVMVGRDIGRVVMPDAPLKIYLSASLEVRARRRAEEEWAQGSHVSLEQVYADLARRDEGDTQVMQPADDAVLLSNDTQTPADTVAQIIAFFDKEG